MNQIPNFVFYFSLRLFHPFFASFFQVEKLALTETLRDTELEVDTLKSELKKKDLAIKEAEERCGHLVRCGEQKNQEHRTFSEVAKNMLINQGIDFFHFIANQQIRQSKVSNFSTYFSIL